MLDLSEESLEENVEICCKYFERMAKIGMTIEVELGITGGEEDGVDNTDVDSSKLYTQPSEVAYLQPIILKNSQEFIKEKHGTGDLPVNFVFHGGSGSSREEIREAIDYGAIKMNLDTDMQWATWEGVLSYYKENEGYLQTQLGNPDGDDIPNKKFYDPRKWMRVAEQNFVDRLKVAFEDLNCINRCEGL